MDTPETSEAPQAPTPVNGPLFTGVPQPGETGGGEGASTVAVEGGGNQSPSDVDNGPVETQGLSNNSGGSEGGGSESGQGSGGENGGEGDQAGGEGDQPIPQPPPEANATSPSEAAPTFDAADGASSLYGSGLLWFITLVVGGVLLVNM